MQVFAREIVASSDYLREVETNLARLRELPVLIVGTDSSPGFKERERERFQRHFPKNRTVVLGNVGRNLQEDAPEEVAAAIAAWWTDEVAPRLDASIGTQS
jgi:haloalkane dehalogenase